MASRRPPDIYEETLAVFDRPDGRFEPLTTPEVADALEAERRTVYERLRTLVDRGDLETKETGSNSRVWWRPPDEPPATPASDGDVARVADETDRERSTSADGPQDRVDYRRIFETIPDGVTLHDPADGRIVDANRQFCEMVGYDRAELLDLGFEELIAGVPPYTMDRAERHIRRTMTDGPQTIEWRNRTKAGEPLPVEVHLRRTTIDGDERVLAVVRDISEREERERKLETRSAAMEASIDGMAILDPDGEYVFVNQAHADVYGYDDREAFLGETWAMCYAGEELARFEEEIMPTLREDGAWRGEATGRRADGTTFPQELSLTATDDGEIVCVVRDITDRKAREREVRETAQQLQGVLDTVEAAIFLKDADGEYVLLNQNCRELVGVDDVDEVVGLTDDDIFPEDVAAEYRRDDERVFAANETIEIEEAVPGPEGTRTSLTRKTPIFDENGDPFAVCGVSTDITERKERERELRAARRFNEELVENAPFGMFRLDEELRITYENDRAEEIIGLPSDEVESAAIGVDIRDLPPIVETGQADAFTPLKDGETVEFEFPFESIYGEEAYFTGRAVPLYRDGEFDGAIMMAIDISERRRHERELERQREQLAALDELNGVVRGITEAVVDRSTRDEIERAVCDRLAESDSYRFARICGADSSRDVEPRVAAGFDGPLEERPLESPSGEDRSGGPIENAMRTREMQVARNGVDDRERDDSGGSDHHEPDDRGDPDDPDRRERAAEHGYRSMAAIPIVHQGLLYGVLAVYSERADAFAEAERAVVGQLGEVIGHAIAAVERKRALLSDEVLELELRTPELLESRGVSVTTDGTITFDRTVPLGDEEYLLYGTATDGAMAVIRAMSDHLEGWNEVRTVAEADDEVRFEQRLSNPPLASSVADHGGYFVDGRIEDGAYGATIHLPPGTDVRRVLADVRETYPNVRSVSQRQVTREEPSPRRLLGVLTEKLTERQRAALEAGYYGGFFEWPRERSGEAVAASLDVGASTFHQHVRKAEKKLLDVLFTEL